MNIVRLLEKRVAQLARQFPAVTILGPRQCGKTTLARTGIGAAYLDLEKPSDYRVLADDPELGLRSLGAPIILDEVQRLPALFPLLRALIDEERKRNGRFFLLGSVDPVLIREVSESLAGRVAIVELTPFLAEELPETSTETLWHRGGFPDAVLAPTDADWDVWQDHYVRTFVERDLARFGLRQSSVQVHTLMGMLAGQQGGLLNASSLGRALGVSFHTVQQMLDILEGHFLVRRLRPYHATLRKRLVKSPKVYVRDSGLLHHLLGVRDRAVLVRSASRGASWEGFVIENLMGMESLRRPATRFWFHRTQTGSEVDLLLDRGDRRIGVEIKLAAAVGKHDAAGLIQARLDGVIHEGIVLHMGERAFPLAEGVVALPTEAVLRGKMELSRTEE
jgi:predicted AAA+ superfamily ATPase